MRAFVIAMAAAMLLASPAAAQTQAVATAPPIIDAPPLLGDFPAANSAAQAADTLAMRPAVTPERLAQARADQAYSPFVMLSSVLGDRFTATRFPRTDRLLQNVADTLSPPSNAAKERYNRVRPYVVDARVLQCDDPGASGGTSPSYPSGHAAAGWAWALVLAELIPSHADAILQRGRAFGESRTICGFHYPSDIEASRILAAGVIARMHADAAFRRDLDAARRELARAYPDSR